MWFRIASRDRTTRYYPGDEYRMLHMEKNTNKANQMLDALNLHHRDEDGFRVHKDGSGTIEMQITVGPSPNPAVSQAAEILKAAWGERRHQDQHRRRSTDDA